MKPLLAVSAHALVVGLWLAVSLAASAQAQAPRRGGPPPPPPLVPMFGDPLPGLTLAELQQFVDGRNDFVQVETIASGLGPVFNNVSCVACHFQPAVGGSSRLVVTRYGRSVNGQFDALTAKGGTLLHQFSISPALREVIPPEANVIAHRRTPPLFGLGLIEAIPDAAIRLNAQAAKPDGVRGKVSVITDVTTGQLRVGRLGWKAQHATLLAFAADAYLNELGITSRFFPHDIAPNGNTNLLHLFDSVADPEDVVDAATGKADVDRAADFMRLLNAPTPLPLNPAAQAGQTLFTQLGCAVCHQPSFTTGPSPTAALNHQPVPLYSDLLLHDMGSLGDGIAQSAAGPREMKTPPLWGLRGNPTYLHDGRAGTVDQAIRAHAGAAATARGRYVQLTPAQQQQLLEFLHAL